MAELSLLELRKRPGRIETFVNKLKNKTPFDMTSGDTKVFTKVAFTEGGKVLEFNPSKDPRQFAQAIEWLKTRATNSRYVLVMNDKDRHSLGDLLKSGDFGGMGGKAAKGATKGNRGDMAEGVFAAAITARFINKNATVSESDVIKIIDKLDNSKMHQEMMYPSPNKNPKIKDNVCFKLSLAPSNLQALTDKTTQVSLAGIIQSSVKYANSAIVTSWSKMLYENNRVNNIEVVASGIGDQKGTKVDVRVLIDGKQSDINVSLKADDVKQFGQISGSGFDKQDMLWTKLLGIDVSRYEENYYEGVKQNDVLMGIASVYKGVANDFNKMVSGPGRKKIYSQLSAGIRYFATLDEPAVTLVQLSRQEASVYQFDNLEKLIGGIKLKATYISNKATPELAISDEKGNVLVSVRVKREMKPAGVYIRNYIEKGKLLTTLASYMAK